MVLQGSSRPLYNAGMKNLLSKLVARFIKKPPSAVYTRDGYLRIPSLYTDISGREHAVVMRLIAREPLRFEVLSIDPVITEPLQGWEDLVQLISFQCNVCGHTNQDVPLQTVVHREAISCSCCASNLRMRSVVNALSQELFKKSLCLPDFPEDKSICGIGMSDWEGYAVPLSRKLNYTNTFYHMEPRLDITDIRPEQENQYDFIISSDVFEHIPPPVSQAFRNAWRLLKPGGVMIFTVPYVKDGSTVEHFPELHDFKIVDTDKARRLINITHDGREQFFDDLVFHGGEGFTLEMREFSEPDLLAELSRAGFTDLRIYSDKITDYGIIHPCPWALPIAAHKPA